jgi:hypothetical protein
LNVRNLNIRIIAISTNFISIIIPNSGYLLNGESTEETKTALTVENTSSCNMVLTVSGNNYFKRIPIGKGKIGSVMIPKNQTYTLSGMVCKSSYQTSKFISGSYSVKLLD